MKTTMKVLLVAALLAPLVSQAQGIRNSRHDLSFSSTAGVKATAATDTEICKFCHTAHKAQSTQLAWNHVQTAATTYTTWGLDLDGAALTKTMAGTPLAANIKSASRRCFGCHDGTIAIGSATNNGGGTAGIMPTAVVATRTAGNLMLTTSPYAVLPTAMGGNHPVSIPYAGQTAYNGLTSLSKASGAIGEYYAVLTAGCSSASGLCTTAPATDSRNGAVINLLPNAAGGVTNIGIECTSCHEPHNDVTAGNLFFLRVTTAASGLCRSCHNQ